MKNNFVQEKICDHKKALIRFEFFFIAWVLLLYLHEKKNMVINTL